MKLSLTPLLLRCQMLTLFGIVLAQAFGQSRIASLLFTLTFPLTLGLWLSRAFTGISRENLLSALTVVAALGCTAGNALLTGTAVSLGYFRKVIMFSASLLYFGCLLDYVPAKGMVRWCFRWNTALALTFAALYLLRKPHMFLLHGRVSGYLTFRFTNPNLAAVFLGGVCMLEIIQVRAYSEKKQKIFHGLLGAVLAVFVWHTQARNAMLLLLLFTLGGSLERLLQLPKGLAAFLVLLPLMFALGYLLFLDAPPLQALLGFWDREGKGLDSRQGIWLFAWEGFRHSPLLGAYSQISGGTGSSQMHNSHVDVLASYGIFVFALFCRFLYGLLRRPSQSGWPMLCRVAFGALLLSGIGEAMLFSGGMGIYLLPGILLMLANFDAYENSLLQ